MADVGCAGMLVADTFCGPMRALPEEGSLLALDSMPSSAGGCAANVAICLAKQGIDVDIAGCLGRDPGAGILLSCFEEHGVGCARVSYTDAHPTSQTVILLVEGQDRRYLHVFGANKAFTIADIDRDWLAGLKVFYLGGLFAMPAIRIPELVELLAFCRAQGVITVVDVVLPQQFAGMDDVAPLLPVTDYFLPNDDEARQITGHSDPRDQLRALTACGDGTVVITLGADGTVARRGDTFWRCGAHAMQVVDPSGSGDAFDAGLIVGILRGWDLPRSLSYASALGASATRAVGTTPGVFSAGEAEAFMAEHPMAVDEMDGL